MTEIFDLTRIRDFINEKQPDAVIIVDTNIVITEPDFANWKTSFKQPLFIMSDVIVLELELLKQKQEKRQSEEGQEKFGRAIRGILDLCLGGNITDGISIAEVGWFISVPSARESVMKPELDEYAPLVAAFGQSDTKLLLLARELNQSIKTVPTIVATGDYNLCNILKGNDIPSYAFRGFPMSGLEELVAGLRMKPLAIDWDDVLHNVQEETEKEASPAYTDPSIEKKPTTSQGSYIADQPKIDISKIKLNIILKSSNWLPPNYTEDEIEEYIEQHINRGLGFRGEVLKLNAILGGGKPRLSVSLKLNEQWAGNFTKDELVAYLMDRLSSSTGLHGEIVSLEETGDEII